MRLSRTANLNLARLRKPERRGAAHVIIGTMLFTFAMMTAFSVDFAYMQLVRTELRSATDAAAKAGAETLVRTHSPEQAIAAAVDYASRNTVGGRDFEIAPEDVILGRASALANGQWEFEEGAIPYNAVRVKSKVGGTGVFAPVQLFFNGVTGVDGFSTTSQATAGQQEIEICLCIDRSASMSYDMRGIDYRFARRNPLLYPRTYYPSGLWRNICSPPHPTGSRWATVNSAVQVFLNQVSTSSAPPRTSLITWSSEATLPFYPETSVTDYSVNVELPAPDSMTWATNSGLISDAMEELGSKPMAGETNISAGLDAAVQLLTATTGKVQARKVIILFTDGVWTNGRDPIEAAQDAADANVTIHCVSMLTDTQQILTEMANLTGGVYYSTSNEAELETAFRELAERIPIVMQE